MDIDINKFGRTNVIFISEQNYTKKLIGIVKKLICSFPKICYITINQPYVSIVELLEKNGIKTENIFFIDPITPEREQRPHKNCIFVSSPAALTELGVSITTLLYTKKFDCFILDSLNTLMVYNKEWEVLRFLHTFVTKLKTKNCMAIITCLEAEKESEVVKNLAMFIDKFLFI